MKKIILFSFVVLGSLYGYSQGKIKNYQQIIETALLHPGDDVAKFKDLLIAEGDNNKVIINLDAISAKVNYTYLPALSDSIVLGDVRFKYVTIQINNDRKVAVVNFTKEYPKKSDFDSRDYLHQQYFSMAEYLDTALETDHIADEKQSKVYKKDGNKVAPHITNGLIWKKDNISYHLVLDETPVTDYATKVLATLSLIAWKNN